MRVDLAPTPRGLTPRALAGRAAVVIDVVRTSTTIVTALVHGARGVIPARSIRAARERARALPPGTVLLGGEREGERIPGFALGNSPREYTPERVGGKTVVMTTSNGTRALLMAGAARATAVAGFINLGAVTRWVLDRGDNLVILCAGKAGGLALEDTVCGGLLIGRLREVGAKLVLTDAARAAEILADRFRGDIGRALEESEWARTVGRRGHGEDLELCARLDAFDVTPRLHHGTVRLGQRATGKP